MPWQMIGRRVSIKTLGDALIRHSASIASLCGFLTPSIIASIIRRPLTPMMSLITESSLMLAPSSVFWIR